VRARGPAADVAAAAQRLRRALIDAYDVPVAPRRAPDLRAAAAAYAAHCATCHGAEGRGDGPAARALSPPPVSCHDRERLAQRSVYGLYSTITLGVAGTAMTRYAGLPEDERWGLAFFVANLGVPATDVARGADLWRAGTGRTVIGDLRAAATLTERQARERGGDEAALVLAYLRGRPDAVGEDALARSERLLRESAAAYLDGRREAAQALATAAYLEGFELVEPGLPMATVAIRSRGVTQ
jgi:high-affinity iron transporter